MSTLQTLGKKLFKKELRLAHIIISNFISHEVGTRISTGVTSEYTMELSSTVLQKFNKHIDYKYILTVLEDEGIIAKVSNYHIGNKCYSYRLIDLSLTKGYKLAAKKYPYFTELCSEEQFLNDIERYSKAFESWKLKSIASAGNIDVYNDTLKQALYEKQLIESGILQFDGKAFNTEYLQSVLKDGSLLTTDKIRFNILQTLRINNRFDGDFTTDNQGVRFFNCISTLNVTARKLLRFNIGGNSYGSKSIDIVNSQFQFLAKALLSDGIITTDSLFFELCSKGKLYDYVVDSTGYTRPEVKKAMLKYIYSSNSTRLRSEIIAKDLLKKINELFETKFSPVHSFLITVNDGKMIARAMQKMEAIVMNKLRTQLRDKGCVFFSVHDDITYMDTNNNREEVEKTAYEVLTTEGILFKIEDNNIELIDKDIESISNIVYVTPEYKDLLLQDNQDLLSTSLELIKVSEILKLQDIITETVNINV